MNKAKPPPVTFPVDMTPKPTRTCLCVWSLFERCSVCDPEGKAFALPEMDPASVRIMACGTSDSGSGDGGSSCAGD
jgi:hypothetical protein